MLYVEGFSSPRDTKTAGISARVRLAEALRNRGVNEPTKYKFKLRCGPTPLLREYMFSCPEKQKLKSTAALMCPESVVIL